MSGDRKTDQLKYRVLFIFLTAVISLSVGAGGTVVVWGINDHYVLHSHIDLTRSRIIEHDEMQKTLPVLIEKLDRFDKVSVPKIEALSSQLQKVELIIAKHGLGVAVIDTSMSEWAPTVHLKRPVTFPDNAYGSKE